MVTSWFLGGSLVDTLWFLGCCWVFASNDACFELDADMEKDNFVTIPNF